MYNSRHSFITALAREGVEVRTIQMLMRHKRLSTTGIYMGSIARSCGHFPASRDHGPLGVPARWHAYVVRCCER
jgi:hypothetical protein